MTDKSPEERFEEKLAHDPGQPFKEWRYRAWRYDLLKAKSEEANMNFRMALVREALRKGEWYLWLPKFKPSANTSWIFEGGLFNPGAYFVNQDSAKLVSLKYRLDF